MSSIYQKIIEIENSNIKAAVCTIVNTKGSTPRKKGAKMIVYSNGSIDGTIGGGTLEKKVIEQAQEALKENESKIVIHNLVSELAMCCGGTVEIFIEPIMNKKNIYIFGAGHIGKALAKYAITLDFDVSLIDERYEAFEGEDFSLFSVFNEQHALAIEKLRFDENCFIVILTHNHSYDREILALCSKKPHQYIGMIGSERKVAIAKKNIISSNILNQEELEKIDMPIGIPIKAITPQEIAISIIAKLIDIKNTKH